MPLETATYVANLDATNPTSTDPKSQGDDHLRMLKYVLQNSFAGFPGMVIVTGMEAQGATANDYVVTVNPPPAAYTDSMLVLFKASHSNTGAATLQINSLSAKPLIAGDAMPLKYGDLDSGSIVGAYYDGTNFYLVSGNDRVRRNGDTYSGTHDFTAATVNVTTQTRGDNSEKAASTAYVDQGLAIKADVNSPALTGAPTAPTPPANDNSANIATTAFVVQQAFQAALPAQPNDGAQYVLTSQNGVASWGYGTPGFILMSKGVI
jgi:hypothetical protein